MGALMQVLRRCAAEKGQSERRRERLRYLGRDVISAAYFLDEDELVSLASRIAAAAIPALDGRRLAAHRIGVAICAAIREEEFDGIS